MLMRPYGKYIVLLLAMMLLNVALGMIPPQIQRTLIDKVLTVGMNRHWLKWILIGFLSVAAARCVINIFIGRTSSWIGTRITRELRERLNIQFLSLGVDYYDRHSVGNLMSRVLHDVDFFHGFVVQVAQGFLLNCMLVLGIGVVLFFMNWRLAILVMLPIPLVVVGTLSFYRYIFPRYYQQSDSRGKMSHLLAGFLSGIRLVKAFGQEKREHHRFAEGATYMQDTQRAVEMSVMTFNPVMAFVFNLGGLMVWYSGGEMVLSSKYGMTLGKLLAFATYLSMFYQPITAMTVFSNWVTGFLSAAQRVFEVLDAVPSLAPPRAACPAGTDERRGRVPQRDLRLRPLRPDPEKRHPDHRAGPVHRHRGQERIGEDDAGQPHLPVLRPRSAAKCASTTWTCATSNRATCTVRWVSCCRSPSCSATASPATSPTASPRRAGHGGHHRRGARPTPTISWRVAPWPTTHGWASKGRASPAASASASASPARFWATRGS